MKRRKMLDYQEHMMDQRHHEWDVEVEPAVDGDTDAVADESVEEHGIEREGEMGVEMEMVVDGQDRRDEEEEEQEEERNEDGDGD